MQPPSLYRVFRTAAGPMHINVVEYILVCKKSVPGLLSFVNFDVDVPGKPFIVGSSSSFLVNANVFSDHKFVRGGVRL